MPTSFVAAGGSNNSIRSSVRALAFAVSPACFAATSNRVRTCPSRYNSERIASFAVRRFGVSRKMSLKTSSDIGPVYPASRTWREESLEIELALPGKTAIVARPLQDVHDQQRRIGQLHEKYLVAGDLRDAGRVIAQRKRVKAVENQAEVRVVCAPDDRPRLAIAIDHPAPGQRLVADAQIALRGALGKFMKLCRCPLLIRDDVGGRIGAHQHHWRAQRLHHVELALGAVEVAPEGGLRSPFEIPKRLVELACEPEVGGDGPTAAGEPLK